MDNNIYIYCENETKLLLTFGEIIARYRPDIITGFNDFNFDWKVVSKWIKDLNIEKEFYSYIEIFAPENTDRLFYERWVKLEGDMQNFRVPSFTSFLSVDSMIVFTKTIPKKDKWQSLEVFANTINKSKDDVPYYIQHAIIKKLLTI